MSMRGFAAHVAAVVVIALGLAGCATNPATSESQLSLISRQQEIQMGRQAAQQARQTLGLVDDRARQQSVDRIGRRCAAETERPDLPWSFAVVDDPTPNAFALPGGFIFVTRGMMNLLTSEAQLASILGHEIAHVTARHAVNQLSKQQLAQLGLGLGGIFVPEVHALSPVSGTGLNLLFLKYSRDDEREADKLGFQYARRQGYDVSEFADVFAVLQRASHGSAGALPGWLSTHPAPPERVETARQRAVQAGAQPNATVGREAYLRRIDGLVYGQDPRHGFFRETVFYHPELRLQVRLPQGWDTRSLARAVVGVAPQGAAAFQLMLAGGSVAQALQRLRQEQGVQFGRPVERAIDGLDAVIAEFIAQTENGSVRGVAAFVSYGGRTYQMVAYADRRWYGRVAPELRNAVQSFAPVSNPQILSVEPQRIDVVQIDRSQTLREFVQRYPSAVPVGRLALLNQLPSESTRIEAGTLVKRVVS
jgi:predicted Zn-dependent protease